MMGTRLQKSALPEFEAKLVIHKMGEARLKKSMEEARRAVARSNRGQKRSGG